MVTLLMHCTNASEKFHKYLGQLILIHNLRD